MRPTPMPSMTSHNFFDFTALSARARYKLLLSTIVPRPIAWIVTLDPAGCINVAPFSFFNAFATDPPTVGIGIGSYDSGRPKDTRRNIRQTAQFVVNLVSEDLAEAMNITAIDFEPGVSELAEARLVSRPSVHIRPPRIADAPVAMECQLMQMVQLGSETELVLGQVLAMHIREDLVLDDKAHHIDTPKLNLIGRMHGNWYTRSTNLFRLDHVSRAEWRASTSSQGRSDDER